ncbi:circularly permuted type 2 ATP-grasp protein [Nocardia thailandica]|uniref:circularly permuted type 2 ATP-grasp protein n=1 Tax=Nocardia thailandica TaxID=257275 RepID=UPI00030B4008
MTQRDDARREAGRGAPGVHPQVAEQFARYRAESRSDSGFDECGRPTGGYYDELVDTRGRVRSMWSELSADFAQVGMEGLGRIDHRVRRQIEDDGITYTEVGTGGGADAATPAQWRLDPIPLLVSADDWTRLETGLVQRSQVLDEVLTDVYGPRRLITSGLLPPELVFGNVGYVRAAHGITVPGRHQLFLHACDISRWSDGKFRVLADWAQAPSGAGYALADRRVVASAIPEAFEHAGPRPLTPFARAMRLMLEEAAPELADGEEPVVVVLSPGSHSETAFDQAYLAQTLGFPLVESADLVVRDGALWMRSLGTLERVDVVLRRVDAEFSDPLDLRPDSQLGVVGLVEVLRRGAVTVVNTLGSGLLESPALAALLPRVCRSLLGEDLLLEATPSYWGGDATERQHLRARLDELVIRSAVDGTTYFGPTLSAAERADLAARVDAETWKWVGIEPAEFSVAPAIQGAGAFGPAPVGMRLFSLARRGGYTAMTGGLGQQRMRLEPTRSVIKVAAKDVWVRTAPTAAPAVGTEAPEERLHRGAPVVEAVSSPRVLNDLFWMGRYGERAESVVRLLIAVHDIYQDYRYRPWLDGAESLPVLLRALSVTTGAPAPEAVFATHAAKNATAGQAATGTPDAAPAGDTGTPRWEREGTSALARALRTTGSAGEREDREPGPDQVVADQSPGDQHQQQRGQARAAAADARPETAADTGRRAGGRGDGAGTGEGAGNAALQAVPSPGEHPERKKKGRGRAVTAERVAGASAEGYAYLASLTADRDQPGSLAFAVDHFGAAARAVRDQVSNDTWMVLGALDRALAEFRSTAADQENAMSAVHSLSLAGLLSLSGIGAESLVRDTGWYVMDIGKRIERGLAITALLDAALTRTHPAEVERVVSETVLVACESLVSYRRRHRGSARIAAMAALLLFDPGNPRSLIYQLDRLEADLQALPGGTGSSRPQRILADAQRMLRRIDPADLEHTDDDGVRTELAELLEGVHLRLRKLSESFETTKLALPAGHRPLWGNTRMVG